MSLNSGEATKFSTEKIYTNTNKSISEQYSKPTNFSVNTGSFSENNILIKDGFIYFDYENNTQYS